uniref:Serine phosphatase n=1 Tax=Solibacter usitatus (strain Ellin6076) TaxID=234267 RepID=Q01YF8_SOLUE
MLQALQSWKSAKAMALLIVLALAIGIGSATAIYTVINTLLLTPVPFEHGERFVSVLGASFNDPERMSSLTPPDVREIRQRARSFDVFGWMRYANYNLTAPGPPLYLNAVLVTPALANRLGVPPRLGRWFAEGGAEPAVVISYGLWQRLGADPGLLNKSITLDGRVYPVSGVMPPGFQLPLSGPYNSGQIDIWLPLDPSGRGRRENDGSDFDFAYARLRPGVTLAQAQAEVKQIAASIAAREPASHLNFTARVDDLRELVAKDVRPILLLLFAAAILLLLLTCANVGGLLVSRSIARARDTAVRVALGAELRQLALQFCLEGICVSLPGAIGGLLFAALLVRLLVSYAASTGPRINELGIDWRVISFALTAALLAALLSSLAPLWQAGRTLPNEVLSAGVRGSAGARSNRLSRSLVVAEIALAFVLLTLSALMVGELRSLTRVWPGFDPNHLLTFQLTFATDAIPGRPGRVVYQARLVDALQAIPGVTAAGFVNQLPMNGCCLGTSIYPEGPGARASTGEAVSYLPVNPDYFRAIQIPLHRGRFLTQRDTGESPLAVVINEATAKRYWPNQDPVSATGHFNHVKGDPFQVVGVIANVRNNGLDNAPLPEIYLPALVVPVNPMNFVVRSPLPEADLVRQVRAAIRTVNPAQPIQDVRMMTDVIDESVSVKRIASYVMIFFALAALLLATLGAYGVVSYAVRQRTVEIGTRMALGALMRDLLSLVVGSGLKMAAWGIAIGGAASVAAAYFVVRALAIHNIGALPFVIAAVTITIVTLASSFFPAWSATMLSPMVAIRNDPDARWTPDARGLRRLLDGLSRGEWRDTEPAAPDTALMTELIDASRRATSFRDAIRAALESVRAALGAQSALILESDGSGPFRSTISVPESAAEFEIPRDGLLSNRLRTYAAPLPVSAADLDAWQRWAAEYRPDKVPEIETLRRTGVRLAVSLRTSKEVIGILMLGPPLGRDEFYRDEKRLLLGCADQFALLLENARLTGRVLEQEKLRRDVALAAEVQKRLLPSQSLATPSAKLAAVSIPARSVGGDYYDFLDLGAGRTGIALADVAGKGVPAALIMSVVQASLRVLSAQQELPLPDLAASMNHFLYRSTGTNSYATFFYAQWNDLDRRLRYVNAGHNPPYLFRAGGEIEELPAGGTVIGLFPRAAYDEVALELYPGDLLIAFTDGVPEALNPADEEFGEDRLKSVARSVAHLSVEEMSSHIVTEMKKWIQDAPQYDDLTFVLLKVM